MTARTYAYCISEAPPPWELATGRAIERFGVKAVTGRDVLTCAEIRGIQTADVIVRLFQRRAESENWAEWTKKNPRDAEILEAAQKIWQTTRLK